MIKDSVNRLISGKDTKSDLLEIKQSLNNLTDEEFEYLRSKYVIFTELLKNDDPKVRKNSVLILAFLKVQDSLSDLVEAYRNETTNYNKASYIKAVSALDHSPADGILRERFDYLKSVEPEPDNKKHIIEEQHELGTLLFDSSEKHEFTGWELVNEAVLLTNRNFKNVTMKSLAGIPHKEFTAGVMVKTKQISYVMANIRTFSEMLFVPEGIKTCSSDPAAAAAELIDADIIDYIRTRFSNPDCPFRFRVDYRARDEKKKADFEKKLASELEFASHWTFINSTSDYELEFRFIDTNDNKLVILLKFCSIPNKRFAYRKESISVGMKPYLAALCAELAKDYFKDNAVVLDPFCGCGTMLIERDKAVPARMLYGIDIYNEAVKACDINIRAAGIGRKTELITKDFFEFHHDYLFDEIITDMPFETAQKSRSDIESIYKKFFSRVRSITEPTARLFIYSRNREYLRRFSLECGLKILAEFEISKTEGTYFYILSVK